jgi:hypothetical protein
VGGEVGEREGLVGVDEIEAVVRDARPVRGGRLGRADVEPAIDLTRVGGDDGDRPALAAERLAQPDRELGLAGGRRARDDDEGWNPRTDG